MRHDIAKLVALQDQLLYSTLELLSSFLNALGLSGSPEWISVHDLPKRRPPELEQGIAMLYGLFTEGTREAAGSKDESNRRFRMQNVRNYTC